MSQTDWIKHIHSGQRIYIGSNACLPRTLINQLIAHKADFQDIEIVQISTLGEAPWARQECEGHFKVNALFIHGQDVRQAVEQGRADYTPVFLSEISTQFRTGTLPLDVALIMVSPPDEFGYVSCGVGVDVNHSAARAAKKVIAQVNPLMPRTSGNSFLHVSQFAAMVRAEEPLPELPIPPIDDVSQRIGQYVSMLVPNRATLQLGIGVIPNAVLSALKNHVDLGLHTEMFSDGLLELMEYGVITNKYKTFHPGKSVTSFCMGSQRLYDYVNNNPHIEFLPSSYVNLPSNIAKNDNMISINSALQVDLTGQVVADSIGHDFYSGIGGQMDFVSGATMSVGGKAIIALPSTAKHCSISRIVPTLTPGAGVVTSRGHVDYVVTEYGIAALKGKSVRERALELIRIAHPKFRAELLEQVRQYYWVPDYQAPTVAEIPEWGTVQLRKHHFKDKDYIVRPLHPADERSLQDFFYSHSDDTLVLRYGYTPEQLSRQKSSALVSVDQSVDCAIAIIEEQGKHDIIHAVGRFYQTQNQGCEIAFVTRESSQGQGMASYLVENLISIARDRGLSSIYAMVRARNKPMLAVFYKFGFEVMDDSDIHEKELLLKL
jgi:acyl-CoA hydrolase/ribosomal protein S18 acetylase RimI-like enzyme